MTEWLQFFRKSGIEKQDAEEYSSYFVENKITFDMLSELNSQYLKELGVTKVGHQIKILRHAKKIESENLRSKILSKEDTSPIVKPVSSAVAMKPLPRVEEKPKVTITVKRPAEKIDTSSSKSSIFDRLGKSSDEEYQPAQKRKNIFARLGNYDDLEEQTEKKLKAISLQTKTISTSRVIKPERPMLVARDPKPTKIQSRLSGDDKQVKFSKEVEFRLYSDPDFQSASSKLAKAGVKNENVKARLGFKESPRGDILAIKKTVQQKPTTRHPVGRFTATPGSLVSDTSLTQSVHSRLGNKSAQSTRKRAFVS